jgi:hypothetical protein
MLLQTLNLIAAIFIDDTERAEIPQELHGIGASKITLPTHQQHPTYLRLLDAIHEVLKEARRTAEEVFNQIVRRFEVQVRFQFSSLILIVVLNDHQLVDLELALKLLGNSDDQERAHMSITPRYRHALDQS